MIMRDAMAADWAEIQGLLTSAGMPTQDIGPGRLQGFLVLQQSPKSGLLGLAGLQRLSPETGLLRSLAIAEAARGAGFGSQLVEAVEAAAVNAGLRELWLLTIDADQYFSQRGYAAAARKDVPDSVRQTAEFSSLCPGDAVVMHKSLAFA